ncbi:hypothetical protein K502DRAFT_324584 [Neoconidiobolus thromboides FSU 785]|nr:hypothetical protein K502DRAFT_324584 [Neoconidiobolus thromboides FSU 785]
MGKSVNTPLNKVSTISDNNNNNNVIIHPYKCECCQIRRLVCNMVGPKCNKCIKHNTKCSYSDKPPKRNNPKPGYYKKYVSKFSIKATAKKEDKPEKFRIKDSSILDYSNQLNENQSFHIVSSNSSLNSVSPVPSPLNWLPSAYPIYLNDGQLAQSSNNFIVKSNVPTIDYTAFPFMSWANYQ